MHLISVIGTENTPDQIPDKWLESFSIRDRDALFYSLPDRLTPTPPHSCLGKGQRKTTMQTLDL